MTCLGHRTPHAHMTLLHAQNGRAVLSNDYDVKRKSHVHITISGAWQHLNITQAEKQIP